MYALNLAEDGRILSATYPAYAPSGAVTVEALPDGDISEYRYVDGELRRADDLAQQKALLMAAQQRAERTAELRATDAALLDALDGLLDCTSLTDFLAALMAAGEELKETLATRRTLREQIAALADEERG